MKNLLIYISPEHSFLPEYEKLVRIQIDNSLELGWNIDDIMLVTNFWFEYEGVKSIVVSDYNICPFYMYSGKINTLIDLWDLGFIKKGELYWYHDFDAFQNEVITEEELGLQGFDVGMTDYGRKSNWNGGSSFIKYESRDIWEKMRELIYSDPNSQPIEDHIKAYYAYSDEVAIKHLTDTDEGIRNRIKRMDIKYNFNLNPVTIQSLYDKSKPVKVFHFHKERMRSAKKLLNDRLINLFNKYDYTSMG
jgi:hypothetical protein